MDLSLLLIYEQDYGNLQNGIKNIIAYNEQKHLVKQNEDKYKFSCTVNHVQN